MVRPIRRTSRTPAPTTIGTTRSDPWPAGDIAASPEGSYDFVSLNPHRSRRGSTTLRVKKRSASNRKASSSRCSSPASRESYQ
jgi:hypothetical protein